MELLEYWRSSASFRIRIGLNLKSIDYTSIPIDLRMGEQHADYSNENPTGLVPALRTEHGLLGQSVAILEYLEETYPEPRLLPEDPYDRAQVRSVAQDIACDIHPLNNLRVLDYLKDELNLGEDQVRHWYHTWLTRGFTILEQRAERYDSGVWFFQNQLTLADVLLVPQIYNALKVDFDMTPFPRLAQIYQAAMEHASFNAASPDNQTPTS